MSGYQNVNRRPAIFLAVAMIFISLSTVHGQGRSYSLFGAGASLARGAESPYHNPANLAFQKPRSFSCSFLGISGAGSNSAFSLSDYNRYNGAYLDAAAKQDILDALSGTGLLSAFKLDIRPFAATWGSWAFSTRTQALGSARLAEDVVGLLLNGNELDVTYDFEPLAGESALFTSCTVSYGHTLPLLIGGANRISLGVNMHYYIGSGYAQVEKSHAEALTGFSTIRAAGVAQLRTARGGSGCGVDLGMTLQAAPQLYFSIAAENLSSRLNWKKNTETIHADFQLYATNVDHILENDLTIDEVVLHSDTTLASPSFSTTLPAIWTVAASLHEERYQLALQGTILPKEADLALARSRFVCAGAYQVWPFLWLRAGFGYKGDLGWGSSWGWGLGGKSFRWDFGWQGLGGILPPSWRGGGFASSFSCGL